MVKVNELLGNKNLIKILYFLIDTEEELSQTKIKNKIKISLYGSCASGEDSKESDIDLLIIGNIKRHDIIDEINRLSKKLNKKITIQIFNELEWANMEKKDKAFYERVEKDKIGI